MSLYLGDFAEDEIIYIPFNTFSSNDPSASVTITNLVDADIHVHKDGSVTQIATDGATVTIDYDGITGNHLITIDTSAHADYATGSDYMVRIEGTTVDAGTINAWVGSFSIENRYQQQTGDTYALANGTSGFVAIDTVVDGVATEIGTAGDGLTAINLPNQTMDITGNITGSLSGSVGSVTAEVTADITKVSGVAGAADNLQLMYDGTGYTDGTAPSSRDQVGALTSGSAAISVISGDFVPANDEGETNSYLVTDSLDGIVHTVGPATGGTTEGYYEFQVGANGRPVSITWNGYANNNGSTYAVYAYNFGLPGYEQVGSIYGSQGSTIIEQTFSLTTSHVGTGVDLGKVRFRFLSTDGLAIATDRVLCSYAVVYQSSGYALGCIWVDANATTNEGTVPYVDGVVDNPVTTWAAALALSGNAVLGIKRFQVSAGTSITLSANSDKFVINAYGATVTLNGQSVSGSRILGAIIVGNDSGSNAVSTDYVDCTMGNSTLGLHEFKRCNLKGNVTFAQTGDYLWDYCSSFVADSGTPDVTYVASTTLSCRHYSGGMQINSMQSTNKMSFEGDGQFKIAATCGGGAVSIRGNIGPITDAAAGAVTITQNARIADDTINAQVDISISDANLATAANLATVDGKLPAALVSGRMDSNMSAISDNSDSADNLAASAKGIEYTTVAASPVPTTSTFALTAGSSQEDVYFERVAIATSGTYAGKVFKILSYAQATKEVTFTTQTFTLSATDNIVIV